MANLPLLLVCLGVAAAILGAGAALLETERGQRWADRLIEWLTEGERHGS